MPVHETRSAGLRAVACALGYSLFFASGAAHSQPGYQAPWFGSWVSGDVTLHMEPWEDGIKIVESRNGATIAAFARMDGRLYPQTGSDRVDGITLRPISDESYEYIGTKNGKVVFRSTVSFPGDGRTRIAKLTYRDGETQSAETTWKRALSKGSEAWYGTWTDGKRTFVMEPWQDGFLMQFSWPAADGKDFERGSAFGRFDGRRYPESENPNVDAMSFERLDDRTMTMVHWKNGKHTVTATVSISPDGSTRTSTTKGVSPAGEKVDSVVHWKRVDE